MGPFRALSRFLCLYSNPTKLLEMTVTALSIMMEHCAISSVEQDELEIMLVRRHEERESVHDKYRRLAREPGPLRPPVTEERKDAKREGEGDPHHLVSEGSAWPALLSDSANTSGRAGRTFRDFAVRPSQLRQSNFLALLTLIQLLVPVLCMVALVHHTVNRLESSSARGLCLLCDTGPAGVVGAGHGGHCKFFSLFKT